MDMASCNTSALLGLLLGLPEHRRSLLPLNMPFQHQNLNISRTLQALTRCSSYIKETHVDLALADFLGQVASRSAVFEAALLDVANTKQHVVLDATSMPADELPSNNVRFLAAAPLVDTQSGVAVGCLCILDTKPHTEPLTATQVTATFRLPQQPQVALPS
jgi:hypothetical protein